MRKDLGFISAIIIHILLVSAVLYESRKWNWSEFYIIDVIMYILLFLGIFIGIRIYNITKRDLLTILARIFAIVMILLVLFYNTEDKLNSTKIGLILTGIIAAIIIPLALVKDKGANIVFVIIYYATYYLLIINILDQIELSNDIDINITLNPRPLF
jgi:membrane-associated HD superfamily phosphohydrolase